MLLEGKTGIVFGVANKRSLAWAIARRAAEEGARIALTYQGERLEENARELAAALTNPLVLPCDVTRDEDIAAVFATVKKEFGSLDFVVHGIAYALREELEGDYLNTSREGYRVAQAGDCLRLALHLELDLASLRQDFREGRLAA